MKKLLAKIIGATTALAMAIGVGFAVGNNRKAEPVFAAVDTYTMADAIGSSYGKYENNDFIVTCGGGSSTVGVNNNETNWGKLNLSDYSKYAVSPVSTSDYATAVVMKKSTSDITTMTFAYTSGTNCNKGSIYAIYSSDNITFSQLTITSGTAQGFALTGNSVTCTFNFETCSGYFGIILKVTGDLSSGSNWKYTNCTLALTHTVSGTSYTVSYNANGGTGTITDTNSPYASGATVTVKDITGFTAPSGKEFTHWYTTSNGTGGTLYNPDDTFNIASNITLYAQWRDQIITDGITDTLNYAFTGLTDSDSGYTSWSGKTGTSGVVYSGQSNAKVAYIQLRNQSAAGIVTTASNKFAKSVSVTWSGNNVNGRSITIYGKHEAYSGPTDLYGVDETRGTSIGTISYISNAKSAAVNLSGNYEFIGIMASAAMYMSSIKIVWQSVSASVVGDDSVDAGTQWSGSVQENGSGNAVTGVTYSFTPSAGAVLSASNTSNGTFTATSAGTVTVGATRRGYVIASKAVTVNAVVTPTLSLSYAAIEGYTGQAFSVVATYANLTSAFAWGTPSGTGTISGSVTNSTGNSLTGTSTYSGTLTGAGTVTLTASGGGASNKTVTFNITQSTVEISGLALTDAMCVGETLNLGSTITVTTTGSYSDDVLWESDDESVATVSADTGIVTGVATGTANITVTAIDNEEVTATCAVTVSKSNFVRVNKFQNGAKYIIAALGYNNPNELYYLPAGTSDVTKNPTAIKIETFADLTEANAWTATIVVENDVQHITFSNVYNAETYYLVASSDAAQGIAITTEEPGESFYWTYDGVGLHYSNGGVRYLSTYDNSSFRYYSSLDTKQIYADVFYKYSPSGSAKEAIANTDTRATLSYNYTVNGVDDYTYTDVKVRLGGFISKTLWESLDAESSIVGYGIMLSYGDLAGESIEYWYNYAKGDGDVDDGIDGLYGDAGIIEGRNCYAELTPSKKNPTMVDNGGNDYYLWNLCLNNFPTEDELKEEYTVVAYIRTNDGIVFFNEVTVSAKSLAQDLIDNDPRYDGSSFEGSLGHLANLA